jgi:hypothetical protein
MSQGYNGTKGKDGRNGRNMQRPIFSSINKLFTNHSDINEELSSH